MRIEYRLTNNDGENLDPVDTLQTNMVYEVRVKHVEYDRPYGIPTLYITLELDL